MDYKDPKSFLGKLVGAALLALILFSILSVPRPAQASDECTAAENACRVAAAGCRTKPATDPCHTPTTGSVAVACKAASDCTTSLAANEKPGLFVRIGDFLTGALSAIADIAASAIGWVIYGVSYFIAAIISIFIALETYVIGIVLQLNGQVMNSLAVQSGFTVTLAVANLGFVLVIVVIAITTILRLESYQMKKTLGKLIAAAILVNFSLVIGGAIINFSNSFTTAFMTALPGGGGGAGQYFEFANDLAGAFAPHRLSLNCLVNSDGTAATAGQAGLDINGGSSQLGSSLAGIITPLFGIIFTVGMLLSVLVVLATFLFMLLIRYMYLVFLLIIMPLAWLMWIVPKYSHLFSEWWTKFLEWCFFAPIVMFFLFLSIATAHQMAVANTQAGVTDPAAGLAGLGYQPSTTNYLGSALSGFLGGATNTLLGTALQMMVVLGLSVGGMFVAKKMSITGAKAALGAAEGGAKAFGKYAGKRAVRTGLESAARRITPKPRVNRAGVVQPAPNTILNALRRNAAGRLSTAAASKGLETKGVFREVFNGAKKGSGLFSTVLHKWQCQHCATVQKVPAIVESVEAPKAPCPVCGALPADAHWKKMS